jgi:hypothetical protein
MRGSYRIIYTQIRPRPAVLLWPSGNLTFCLLETLGSNPDAAQTTRDPRSANQACPPPPVVFHASPVVRVAQRMQARQEQANSPHGTVVVVNSGGNKLPTWKAGKEADGKGFNWKTKQRMVNAWEQYQISEGLHAPKSFKSMIDVDLIPLVCAECQLDEATWETLDDVTLLMAIEEKLKPHDAMGFTVQLKQIIFSNDDTQGTLTQRYRTCRELLHVLCISCSTTNEAIDAYLTASDGEASRAENH